MVIENYLSTQKRLSTFVLFILVLISSAACQGSHDLKAGDHGDIRSGLITVMTHSRDSVVPYPYQIDFSELDTAYYASTQTIPAIEPDVFLSEFDLKAPNGILDHGRVWRVFCYNPPFGIPTYEIDRQPILNSYRWRYLTSSIIAPARGYQTNMDLELCHRYYLRTMEGETVVLIHVGYYIGGINRQYFFWSYLII